MRISDWSSDVCSSDLFWAAAFLMGIGVWLHLTERHEHIHTHDAIAHAHRHVHDEHHQHAHEFPWNGHEPHTHRHAHMRITHNHPHHPDIHHQHRHRYRPTIHLARSCSTSSIVFGHAFSHRSAERRVGKECVSTCRSRG